MTEISEIVGKYNQALVEFKKQGEEAAKTSFKVFFDENPTVKSIIWTQYTPYFNDGDECVFRVNDMYFSTTVDNFDEADGAVHDDNEAFHGTWGNAVPETENFKKFVKEISLLPDDIFKAIFGNHVQVFATRDGFRIEEHEHD